LQEVRVKQSGEPPLTVLYKAAIHRQHIIRQFNHQRHSTINNRNMRRSGLAASFISDS
jgi:hypothetical protein